MRVPGFFPTTTSTSWWKKLRCGSVLVECGASIGWRKEELLGLKVKQLDFEHRILRLEPNTTKNDDGREAPMFGNMHPLLKACVETKGPDDAVFTWPNGKPVESIRDTWARASTNAGLGHMYGNNWDVEVPNE